MNKADELRQRIAKSEQYQRMVEEQLADARNNLEYYEKHVAEAREAVETYEHQIEMMKFEQSEWAEEIRRELRTNEPDERDIVFLLSKIMRETGVSVDDVDAALKLIAKGDD